MNFLVRIDDWVLGKMEKSCHAIQWQFGITNYGILAVVNVVIAGTIVAMASYGIFAGKELPEKYFLTHLVLEHPNITIFFVVIELSMAFWGWKHYEAEAFNRLLRGLANPMKAIVWCRVERILGYFVILVSFPLLGVSLDWIVYLLFMTWLVLISCDPLPPCRGKFWERLEVALAKLARVVS